MRVVHRKLHYWSPLTQQRVATVRRYSGWIRCVYNNNNYYD